MPNRYIASGVPEYRPSLTPQDEYQLPTYIDGNPETGYAPSIAPPKVGYWGITAKQKQQNAAMLDPGNVATWAADGVVSLSGGEQRFVSLGAANLMERQLGEGLKKESGWRWLSNTLSPVRNVADIDARLQFQDDDFDAESETAAWIDNPTNLRLAEMAGKYGFDLPTQMRQARNRDHFVFLQNRALMGAKALQDIETFEEQSMKVTEWASMVQSAVQNYLLTDPTFLPSLFIPLGPGAQAVRVSGQTGLKFLPAALTASRSVGAALPASLARTAEITGRAVGAVQRSPAAFHGALSTATGHRAARAIEMAAYGAAFNAASQRGRIEQSQVIFDDPDLQDNWSWAEFGLVAGASSLLGFALAGKAAAGRADGAEGVRRTIAAIVDDTAQQPYAQPLVEGLDYVRAQAIFDNASVKAQRAAESLLPGRSWVVGEFFDDAVLAEAGMTRLDMEELLVGMVEGFKGRTFDENAVLGVLSSALNEGRVRRAAMNLDDMGTQLERTALSEAMGRAGQEMPTGSAMEIRARAMELLPTVIQRMDDRAARIAAGVGPERAENTMHWMRELAELRESASRRALTKDEIRYTMRVEAKLRAIRDGGADIKWDSVFEGLAQRQGRFDVSPTLSDNPLLRSLQETQRLRKEIATATRRGMSNNTIREYRRILAGQIRELRRLTAQVTGEQRQSIASALEETNEILSRAVAQQDPQRPLQEVLTEVAANAPTTPAEMNAAYGKVIDAMDLSETTLIEDVGFRNKLLFGWGLGKWVKHLIGSGPGMNKTVRSTFNAIAMVAQEIDPNRLTVGDLTGRKVVRTMQTNRNDMEAAISEIVGGMHRIIKSGKFGSQLSPSRNDRVAEFNKAVIRHLKGVVKSDDADVIEMARLWKKHSDRVQQVAADTNQFTGKDNFFPARWQLHRIMKDSAGFIAKLRRHHAAYWRETDELNLDSLVNAGVLTKKDYAGPARWVDDAGVEYKSGELKKSDLPKFNISEEEYLAVMESTMEVSARTTMARLMGEDTYTEDAGGGLIQREASGVQLSDHRTRIDDSVWANPEMEEYLDWNFLKVSHDYLRTTGVRVHNTARHQEQWGIPGGTMDALLDALEARVPLTDPEDVRNYKAGIQILREKLALGEGRMPSMRSQADGVGEYLLETGQALAAASFGSMIGGAVLTTEVLQTMLRGIYSPEDILRKALNVAKALAKGTETKRMMEVVGLTSRQFRYHSLDRFTGGAVDMDSFQFGVLPKIFGPFMDVISQKGSALPGDSNRAAGLARAIGGMNMTLSGMDFFSQFARTMQIMDAQSEAARFFKPAEKLALALRENAEELQRVRTTSGEDAYLKMWKGLASKAGFGSQWQVADKFARSGLLDPEKLAVLRRAGESTGALKERGVKVLDLQRLMTHVPDEADAALLDEAVTGFRDTMIGTMNKRISEQTLMQTPTDALHRTGLGQLWNTMMSFSRSWADNNIMDAAQMPTRTASALIAIYLFGETLNRMNRDILRGRTVEEIEEEIMEDPDNFIARTLTNIPVAGMWTPLLRNGLEAATRNERMLTSDPISSAGFGALASTNDAILDSVQAASPFAGSEESNAASSAVRQVGRMVPLYNTWWFGALNETSRQVFDTPDLHAPVKRDYGRRRSYTPESMSPTLFDGPTNTGPNFDDIDFQIPKDMP